MSISMPRDLTVWTELNVIHKGCPVRGWYRAHDVRGNRFGALTFGAPMLATFADIVSVDYDIR